MFAQLSNGWPCWAWDWSSASGSEELRALQKELFLSLRVFVLKLDLQGLL